MRGRAPRLRERGSGGGARGLPPAADGGSVGVCGEGGHGDGLLLRGRPRGFEKICGFRRRSDPAGALQAPQPVGTPRHARERVGVDGGPVPRGIAGGHRPVARRAFVVPRSSWRILELRECADLALRQSQLRLPRQPEPRRGVPSHEDIVTLCSFTLFPFSSPPEAARRKPARQGAGLPTSPNSNRKTNKINMIRFS